MKEIPWERYAAISVCTVAAGALLFFGAKVIFSFLLPFLLAWGLSFLISPLAIRISHKTHISKSICSVVLFFAVLAGLTVLVSLSINRMLVEIRRLIDHFLDGTQAELILSDSAGYIEGLVTKLGFPMEREGADGGTAFREQFHRMISGMVEEAISSVSAKLPQYAAKMIASLPSVLLFVVITVISGFYFCIDREGIEKSIIRLLPSSVQKKIPDWQKRFRSFSWRYLRVYLLLLFLTFAELLLGFTVLRVEYAFLLALLIAVVDLFPVLGVGTVLIPWGVIELIRRNFYLGFGLLILYLAVTVLRQILEPRLVGHSLGLHPLATLVTGYAGWQLFGVVGMALGPILGLLCKTVFSQLRNQGQVSPRQNS